MQLRTLLKISFVYFGLAGKRLIFVRVYKKATPEGVAHMFYVWKI